jgi:hypothetical protein
MAGGSLTDAQFNLALATALWAVGLSSASQLQRNQVCVPLNQAREAITIWAATLAARPPAGELQQGLNPLNPPVSFERVTEWSYPGAFTGGMAPPNIGFTAATWLNWRTTAAQLAAALGIAMPSVRSPKPGSAGPSPTGGSTPVCTS